MSHQLHKIHFITIQHYTIFTQFRITHLMTEEINTSVVQLGSVNCFGFCTNANTKFTTAKETRSLEIYIDSAIKTVATQKWGLFLLFRGRWDNNNNRFIHLPGAGFTNDNSYFNICRWHQGLLGTDEFTGTVKSIQRVHAYTHTTNGENIKHEIENTICTMLHVLLRCMLHVCQSVVKKTPYTLQEHPNSIILNCYDKLQT